MCELKGGHDYKPQFFSILIEHIVAIHKSKDLLVHKNIIKFIIYQKCFVTFLVSLRDPSFFIRWGEGGGWWDLRGGAWKNGFKGGSKEKIVGLKGGSPNISFKFCSDGICKNTKKPTRMPKTSVSDILRKFKFSRGSMPPDPLLYYAPKGRFCPSKMQKRIKAYQIECFIRKKITNLVSYFFIFFFVLSF